jgi:uncharacterized membrane protein YjgN (DUF898 family)
MHDTAEIHDAPPSLPEKARFTGENADFRRLVTEGALLELLTVGFYRFWLATNIRRHLWSATVLGGDALEYLGTGRELLFGFFFALAILAPVYLVYFLVGLEAERYKAFASVPLALFFVAFGQFALYRARRYRLHRTAWRGLRFGMVGSGWDYARRAILWSLAVFFSLGLALPWAEAALERYKMRNSFYGDLQGDFVGRGGEFLKRAWWIWLAPWLAVLLFVALSPPGEADARAEDSLVLILAGFGVEIAAIFFYGAFKAIHWKWWLEGVRIGEMRATSDVTAWSLIANYWKFIGWFLLVFACAMGLFVLGAILSEHAGVNFAHISLGGRLPAGVLVAVGAWYLFFLLSVGVLWRIYFTQRVWKLVVNSLTLHGLDSAREVRARESSANALGEGFVDSLDVVGF